MEFNQLLPLSALFCLALLGSHVQASLPAEHYWQTLWPNTPMPKAFKDLLVQPPAGCFKQGCKNPADRIIRRSGALVQQQAPRSSKVEVPSGVFFFNVDDDHSKFKNTLEKSIRTLYQNLDTFKMYYHDKKSNDDNKPRVSNGTFFFEHDLLPGKKLILGRIKPTSEFTFLPDKIAKAIPFSSKRLPEILNRLNIEADSTDAGAMNETLALCEKPAIKGEQVYCSTSLESLLDFAVSKLGKNIRLISTEFERETQDQEYSIAAEGAEEVGEKAIVCHKMDYPYAVYLCHKVDTRSFSVPLVATNDGINAKAIAVCHTDTSHWAPNHIAFKMLNTKPGTDPICHFLATETVIWVPQFSTLKDDM